MDISGTVVKKTARTALKGNYFKTAIVSCIFIFAWIVLFECVKISGAVAGPVAAFALLAAVIVFLIFPLAQGFVYYSVRLIFGSDCEPQVLFKYFSGGKEYLRALKLSVILAGNAAFFGIFLFFPVVLCDLTANGGLFKMMGAEIPSWASWLSVLSHILRIIALAILLSLMLKFYLSPFLVAANEDMDIFEALQISKTIARVTRREFIFLICGFIGYIVACVFVIPMIFVFPYFAAAYAVHCRYAVAAYNKNADGMSAAPSFEADISF